MKKTLIIALVFISFAAFAQRGSGNLNAEKIKAARVAFLTEKLDLDSKTAQVFWPVYNEWEAAKEENNKKFMASFKERLGVDNMRKAVAEATDEQATLIMELMYAKRGEDLKLEMAYMDKFGEILSPKQVLQLSQFDAEFRRTLMRRYSEESRQRRERNKNGN